METFTELRKPPIDRGIVLYVQTRIFMKISKKILIYILLLLPTKKAVTRKTYIENENLKGKSNPIARGLNIHCQGKIIRKFSPG